MKNKLFFLSIFLVSGILLVGCKKQVVQIEDRVDEFSSVDPRELKDITLKAAENVATGGAAEGRKVLGFLKGTRLAIKRSETELGPKRIVFLEESSGTVHVPILFTKETRKPLGWFDGSAVVVQSVKASPVALGISALIASHEAMYVRVGVGDAKLHAYNFGQDLFKAATSQAPRMLNGAAVTWQQVEVPSDVSGNEAENRFRRFMIWSAKNFSRLSDEEKKKLIAEYEGTP